VGTRTSGSVGGSGKRSGPKDRHRASGLPNHVVALGSKATDQVRRAEYNRRGRSATGPGKWIKGLRYSLLKDPVNQTAGQLSKLAKVQQTNKRMFRAFLLNGELRYIYRLPKDEAKERLRRGSHGHPDPGSSRSSSSRGQSANTRRACSPRFTLG
jgi:Transposase